MFYACVQAIQLALYLFMLFVLANNHNFAVAFDNFAFIAHRLY